jgi:glutaminyl-peptide cyclotransferase
MTQRGSYQVLATIPHDAQAFTQGLEIVDSEATSESVMYESTGLYNGRSSVRVLDMSNGTVLQQHTLASEFFAEGITYTPALTSSKNATTTGRLIQITWKEQIGFWYDPITLNVLGNFTFTTSTSEGWGIAYRPRPQQQQQRTLLVSDGSSLLHTWDADTLEEILPRKTVHIRQATTSLSSISPTSTPSLTSDPLQGAVPLSRLNELEWDSHSDTLLANVWLQDFVVRIDPESGFVTTVYDLSNLYTDRAPGTDVLNGIATTNVPNEVWVTGKLWPNMYRLLLIA